MLVATIITKWYRVTLDEETGEVVKRSFNHYEIGQVKGDYPQPLDEKFSNQVAWKNDKWQKQFTFLNETYENNKLVSKVLGDSKMYLGLYKTSKREELEEERKC